MDLNNQKELFDGLIDVIDENNLCLKYDYNKIEEFLIQLKETIK